MKTTENSNRSGAHTPPSPSGSNTDDQAVPTIVFVLMGKTGVGKSSFIKLLGGTDESGDEPVVSGSTSSCTLKPTLYKLRLNNKPIKLVDTPGFDDSARDNIELLIEIVSYLWFLARHPEQYQLHGIIFLHDISETRFTGSQQRTFSILRKICGEQCMKNVVVGTTMWVEEIPKKFQVQQMREDEIMKNHWNGIHSTIRLFEDDRSAAASIITTLLSMPPVLLLVQQEILQPPHAMGDTTVGKEIMAEGFKAFGKLQQMGKTKEAGFIETLLNNLKNPAEMSFAEKFGLAIAAPIMLAPAALVSAPLGVIYALVHGVDKLTGGAGKSTGGADKSTGGADKSTGGAEGSTGGADNSTDQKE